MTELPFRDEPRRRQADLATSRRSSSVQVRFGYQKNDGQSTARSPLFAPQSLGTVVSNKYSSILANHQLQVGQRGLERVRVPVLRSSTTAIEPDTNRPHDLLPQRRPRGSELATRRSTPSRRKYQYKDDFSYTTQHRRQQHDFKVGLAYVHEPRLGGDSPPAWTRPSTMATNDDQRRPSRDRAVREASTARRRPPTSSALHPGRLAAELPADAESSACDTTSGSATT